MSGTIKFELLKRIQRAKGQPVSGQQLAEELNISRTAIWKQINRLKEEGYQIETIRKRGYALIDTPDTVDPTKIQTHLKTITFGRNIVFEEQVTSTQPIAHSLAQEGVSEGTVVICEEQSTGRGRMERVWNSSRGKGIWMSVILRPNVPPYKAPQFTLVAAVAVAKAIEAYIGIKPAIKWPNDLLIGRKKITGILTEMQADPDGVKALIMGIGINVNHTVADFPDDLQTIATSLAIEKGEPIDRAALVAEILFYLEQYAAQYVAEGFEQIKKEWIAYSCTIGARIKATTVQKTIIGVAKEITNDGVLKIELADGSIESVYSADITFDE